MKPKTTFILLIVAVLIGAFIWVDHKYFPDTEKSTEQQKRVFAYLKRDDITKLELSNTNGVIVVEKAGDKWEMKKPFEVPASKSDVESILSELEFLDAERTLTPKELKETGATPANYGLDKPRAEASITVKGVVHTLKLGNDSEIGGNLYAMLAGKETVHVLGKSVFDRLNKRVDDLRDRTVIDFAKSDLSKLEIKSGNRQIELTQTPESGDTPAAWRITRPINARASKDKVEGIADKLAALRVDTFVTEDPKDLKRYGLDEPAQEVSLFTKGSDGAKIVQFGSSPTNDTTKVYAKRKSLNSVYTVSNDILTNLVVQVNDLRDRALAEFETDQVQAVEVVAGGQTFQIEKQTNDWEIVAPAKSKAEQDACDDLVSHLHGAEIKEFVADVVTDLAQYGLDKPALEVTLKKQKVVTVTTTNEPARTAAATNAVPVVQTTATTNVAPLVTVRVGKTDAGKGLVYVKRADEDFVYGLETNFVADLPQRALDLRDRTVLVLDSSAVQKFDVAAGPLKLTTERVTTKDTNNVETKEWKLVAPAQGVLAADEIEDAVDALAGLKAERLVEEHPSNLAPYGLDQPALVATVTSIVGTNAPQAHAVLVGKETPDKNRFAMVQGGTLVFELASADYDKLHKEFVTRPEEKPAATNQPPAAVSPPPMPETNAPSAPK